MGHNYITVCLVGEDAPGKSLDEYLYCWRCGTLRHDYRHNGGQTSPHYPEFLRPGQQYWLPTELACHGLSPR